MKTKIDLEGIGLKNFTFASNEEKRKFAKELFSNNEKYQNSFIKENYFIKTLDGYIIALDTAQSLKIHKKLWYDDEQDSPELTKKYFIDYNLKMHNTDRSEYLEKAYKCYFQVNYDFELKNACVCTARNEEDINKKYFIRDLTSEEKTEYIKILQTINLNFIERLSKYFDKYSQNIYCEGYWVNR
jgi:hypothetical protein